MVKAMYSAVRTDPSIEICGQWLLKFSPHIILPVVTTECVNCLKLASSSSSCFLQTHLTNNMTRPVSTIISTAIFRLALKEPINWHHSSINSLSTDVKMQIFNWILIRARLFQRVMSAYCNLIFFIFFKAHIYLSNPLYKSFPVPPKTGKPSPLYTY